MFDIKIYKERVKTDYDSPAWELLERVVAELEARGLDPHYINGIHVAQAYDKNEDFSEAPIGSKHINVQTVYRSNGTKENVSVKITVSAKVNYYSSLRSIQVKVPKNASDKVIKSRVDQIAWDYIN